MAEWKDGWVAKGTCLTVAELAVIDASLPQRFPAGCYAWEAAQALGGDEEAQLEAIAKALRRPRWNLTNALRSVGWA